MAGCELRLVVSVILTPQPTINITQALEVKSNIPQCYHITFLHTHKRKKEGKRGKARDMANMYEEALNSVSELQKLIRAGYTPFITAAGRHRQVDLCKLKAAWST